MTYDFYAQLAVGQAGERKVHDYLSQEWQLIHALVPQEVELGIDYLAFHKTTGEERTFEVKTDLYQSGNCFLETVKNDRTKTLGWAHTCAADRLLYYLPNLGGKLLIIQPPVIRANLPFWVTKFRSVEVPNPGYKTIGLLVPVTELEAISEQQIYLN
ncbi:hypothetical protein [Pantanalinema sp. GBBB05]|uniref:hypothetical protein n=1 Tax=Pantanalinema sp. GBBB05 TaxID=2604139 RepID=UPI001D562D73|nr:hypothetical protein [Pantanalinema sp. GBBB05]